MFYNANPSFALSKGKSATSAKRNGLGTIQFTRLTLLPDLINDDALVSTTAARQSNHPTVLQ